MARFAKAAGQQRVSAAAIMLALVAGLLFWNTAMDNASADHMPANKLTASGSEMEVVGANQTQVILSELVKMPGPKDMVLSVTAECSILTALNTGPGDDMARAEGQVSMWIEIDGTVVPVSSDDVTDTGKVVFCNRVYQRTVTDGGDDDTESDFIDTRSANAFNWLALNARDYDDSDNGHNILEIELWAEFSTDTAGEATAEAIVGHRTMIVEPESVSNHESVDSGV